MTGKAKPRGKGKPFKKGDPRAGRPKGSQNKATVEVREAARSFVEDPIYRESLKARLQSGDLAPAVESMLWHYAYGKPKEQVELSGPDGGAVVSAVKLVFVEPEKEEEGAP
jgi:hypothetical protein